MKRQQTLVNGKFEERISVRNRALQYGDGLFETIAVVNGQSLAWDRHIARLQAGCERLNIECPNPSQLVSESSQLCGQSKLAVLKLIVSRGEGGRGYQPAKSMESTRIFSLHDWPDYPSTYQKHGIEVSVCKTRLGLNPSLAGLKHLNRLEQVLLSQEISLGQNPEGLALDIEDRVIEGSMSNIFIVKNEQFLTPSLDKAGVAGVIRGKILDICKASDLACLVTRLSLQDVLNADEVFLCNSIAGLWPVVRIADASFETGPYTQKLQKQLASENMIVMS